MPDIKDEIYSQGNATTPIPVDLPFDKELHTFFQEAPPQNLPGKKQEVPGFFETFSARFAEQEELIQMVKDQNRTLADNSPIDDYVDPNWDPTEDKTALIGIDPRHTGYILDATGPKDQRRRYNYILDMQDQQERISNGSLIAQLTGGLSGFGASPSSMLMLGKIAKYAKVSQFFLQNSPKIIGGIGLSSAAHEAVIQSTKIGGNLHDWMIDTMIDTVLGSAFTGVGLGLKYASEAGKLFNSKNVLKMMNKGINVEPVIDKKGIVQGVKAVPVDSSVGAAEVDIAQTYLDAALSKNFIHAIPYVGDFIGSNLGKGSSYIAGIISPKIRMFNSQFETMRGFANAYVEHAFQTLGIERGVEIETPFQTYIDILRGSNTNLKNQYNGLFLKYNGIEYNDNKWFSRTKANLSEQQQQYFKDGVKTRDEFGKAVQKVLITEKPSDNAAVNEAAQLLIDYRDPLYLEYIKLHGISDKILKPRTAKGYASIVYNTGRMELEEERWVQEISEELGKDDGIINNLVQPINIASKNLKEATTAHELFLKQEGLTSEQIKQSSDNLDDLKRAKKAAENRLQDELRSNENLNRLIEDPFAASATEAAQINKILKPLKKIEKELNAQKEIVDQLKLKTFSNKQASTKAKTKETAQKRTKLKEQFEENLKTEETKLKEFQDKYDTEIESLQEKMHNKQIPEELYYKIPNSNRYHLKDPKNRLKLRKVYESDFARQTAAKGYYDSILNQTTEDNIRHIMSRATGSDRENPLVQRTLLLRHEFLLDNNWLNNDAAINVMNYRMFVGRQNAIKTVLNRLTVNGTFEELIQRLEKEYSTRKAVLGKTVKDQKKYERKVKSLGKAYKREKEDLRLSIQDMQNKSDYSVKGRQLSRMANLYAVATKLGFLAFTMSTDLLANVFKHGLWPFISDGLIPMIKNLGGMLNTKEGAAIRENAAHAHIAMHHMNTTNANRNLNGTTQTYEPVQGKLTTGLETLAHYSNNFSLANYVENFNERLTAMIIQSKIMKAMLAFQKGKIKDSDLKDLLKYGIDPKQYADRFVNGWKSAGKETNGFGGYQSYYWKWGDTEASNVMSQAILRAVRDTIIRRGPLDAPFAMNNPVFSSIFLFKGYVLASMTRYLAPLMQQATGRQLIGTTLMLAAGATQNPLRRLMAGQDPTQENEHWFRNAIRDGGVFSILGDVYEEINFLLHGFLQETVTNERYHGRTEMGVFNGPVGSIANDMTRILGMVASRQWNQTDLKRIAVNLPFIYSWQFRAKVNEWIKNSGLPKTRAQAEKAGRI